MRLPILTFEDVAKQQLCCGCGACAAADPDRYEMRDAPAFGRRPFSKADADPTNGQADPDLDLCPGVRLEHTFDESDPAYDADLRPAWGPVLEVWEGYAADPDIRFAGSSGGAATALALHCLEREGMHGVLHTGPRDDKPYLNTTVLSSTRDELLARTGSRYAPASPCEGLPWIEAAPAPCVFIGKPCDAAATAALARKRPALADKLGLNIAFFCAGTPSTNATRMLLKKVGVEDPDSIKSLRYRGNGWPGMWTVRWTDTDDNAHEKQLTYAESWDFLQRHRQWRCYICPDHTGEFADIAVGDPWYRPVEAGEPGKSLIVARTERRVLHAAADAGAVVLETRDASLLPRSQENLLSTRGRLFGQLLALRLAGAPRPDYQGFPTRRFWNAHLDAKSKLQSVIGTLKRIKRKRLKAEADVFADGGAA